MKTVGGDWFAPEEMSDGRRTVKTVFRDPRGEGGDLASTPARAKRLAPFSSARLAPCPDGPLTHFVSPRGEKCRLNRVVAVRPDAGRTKVFHRGGPRNQFSGASVLANRVNELHSRVGAGDRNGLPQERQDVM